MGISKRFLEKVCRNCQFYDFKTSVCCNASTLCENSFKYIDMNSEACRCFCFGGTSSYSLLVLISELEDRVEELEDKISEK